MVGNGFGVDGSGMRGAGSARVCPGLKGPPTCSATPGRGDTRHRPLLWLTIDLGCDMISNGFGEYSWRWVWVIWLAMALGWIVLG